MLFSCHCGITLDCYNVKNTTFLPPVAPGLPRMFRVTLMATTSLSFSWQAPTVTNGALTGYNLSCKPGLPADIPSPSVLTPGPTMNTAELGRLSPGVRYNCSIVANNSAGSSDPVHAIGTTTETGNETLFESSIVIIQL